MPVARRGLVGFLALCIVSLSSSLAARALLRKGCALVGGHDWGAAGARLDLSLRVTAARVPTKLKPRRHSCPIFTGALRVGFWWSARP